MHALQSGPKIGPRLAQSNTDKAMISNRPVADIDRQVKYLRPQPELPTLATNAESGDDLYFRARSITMF